MSKNRFQIPIYNGLGPLASTNVRAYGLPDGTVSHATMENARSECVLFVRPDQRSGRGGEEDITPL
jgi:hypothetical protein